MSDVSATLPVHFRVERCFGDELRLRVPLLTWHLRQDNPSGYPPYGVLQADDALETTPKSGVFYVALAVLVTHSLNPEAGGVEHAQRVQEVREALEQIPSGDDVENGVRVHGFVVQRQTSNDTDQEQGTLFELRVGCSLLERDPARQVTVGAVEAT